MASATAQQATHRYFHQSQQERQAQARAQQQQEQLSTAVPSVDGELLPDAPPPPGPDPDPETAHPTTETVTNGSPPPAAPEMDRQPSHQVLTRGHARANPLAALSDLAAAASMASSGGAPSTTRENPFAPVIPAYHAISRAEKSGAPAPPGVGTGDVEGDLALMRRIGGVGGAVDHVNNGVENGEDEASGGGVPGVGEDQAATTAKEFRTRLLDQALGKSTTVPPYRVPVLEAGPAMVGGGRVERPSWTGFAQVAGGNAGPASASYEQQVRSRQEGVQTGFGGVGVGGSALAAALAGRLGGVEGGEAMSRTTSAGGGSEGGEGAGGAGGYGGARRGRWRVV